MIEIMDIRALKSRTDLDGTAKYAIVRSMTYPVAGVEQMAVLSPSKDLFFWYRRKEKAGEWNRRAFFEEYLPRFLREVKANPAAHATLRDLWKRSKNGEHIVLACWCADESMCHRSIIAGLLAGAGADVRTANGHTYSEYYQMYNRLPRMAG